MSGTFLSQLDADCLRQLLSFMSVPTLCRLRSTCKEADALVSAEVRFRVTKGLLDFFAEPDALMATLASTNSVVSGSFFAKIAWGLGFNPNDLDVYTTSEFLKAVIAFLEEQGYKVEGYVDPYNPEYRGGIKRIVRLARGSRFIDVVVSLTQSPTLPIVYFWSTPVMMYFGGNGFCIPYPNLLESERGLLNPGRTHMDSGLLQSLISKYETRGINIRETEEDYVPEGQVIPQCRREHSATCPVTTRFLGDQFCLQSAFGTVSERMTGFPFSGTLATFSNVWWRGGSRCGGDCNLYGETEFDTWTQSVDMLGP